MLRFQSGTLGKSSSLIGFFGATPVVKPAALTAVDATAIDATFGAPELAVLENVRTRVNSLEARLQGLGLLT